MKASDVKIGGLYVGKVGERLVVVEVLSRNTWGGWTVRSLLTGRETRFASPQKFRKVASQESIDYCNRQREKKSAKKPTKPKAARATRPAARAPKAERIEDPDDLFSATGSYLRDLVAGQSGALARRAQVEIDRRAAKRAAKRQAA